MAEQETRSRSLLHTERGTIIIQDNVVAKIAGVAAQEVGGVRLGGGTSQAVGGILSSVPGVDGGSQTRGVTVEVGREEAAEDLTVTVEYGRSIPQVAEAVRRNVIGRIESLTGLRVTDVNLTVDNVFFPEEEQQQQG
jgi:uncharacterized alkaline shock family protein YloU